MRLLYVIRSLDSKDGGTVQCVLNLAYQHIKTGVMVDIVCLDSPECDYILSLSNSIDIYALGHVKPKYGYSKSLRNWLSKNAKHYDCIILNGLWQYPTYAASRASIKYDIPYVLFTHGMMDVWFKRKYPIKHLKKLLYWLLFERRTLNFASRVIYTSPLERLSSRGTFPFFKENFSILSLGIDASHVPTNTSVTSFLNKFDIPKKVHKILFLSRVDEKKGCDLVLKAFAVARASFPDIYLIIAGPGDTNYIADLRCLANQLGIEDHLTWTGMLTGDDKFSAFKASDVFLLPSHQENFCIAVAEALSFSLPVLISNKINIFSVIYKYCCGFVSNDDLEGTTSNLMEWLSLSSFEKIQMRINSYKCFEENFRIESTERDLIKVIESVI